MHFGAELRLWRGRLVVLLAATLMVLNMPAARADQGTPTSRCLVKQGPVGNAFVDCSGGQVFNIVPPGETGTYDNADFGRAQAGLGFPPHTRDQEPLYANLLNVAPSLAAADISKYYKDAGFLADLSQAERVETFPSPHQGTVIIRDSQFGVPHIYGKTRADTEFGSGFVSAEDRLFEMDVLRHVGRAQLTSFIGASAGNIAMDCGVAAAAGYSESELQQQVDNFAIQHPDPITIGGVTTTEGQQIKDDAAAYVNGVNEYETEASAPTGGVNHAKMPAEYGLLQIPLLSWKATDIVATATLIQAIFATGGGNEVGSALLYQSLVNRYGQGQGTKVWADLRSQNDPEAQVSIKTPFSYEQVPPVSSLDPNSLAMPVAATTNNHCNPPPSGVPGQFSAAGVTVDLTPLLSALQGPPHLSNELIVDAAHSATGHPVAVFGPQTSYYVPELLHEVDLHGPGLQARGVSFAGTEVFVELGRGVDYAWSATSAGADIVDQRIEKLCNPATFPAGPVDPNGTSYVFDDGKGGGPKCIPMYERTDTQVGKPSPGCTPDACPPAVFNIQIERTVHGPVVGRTTAIDPGTHQPVPVAVSSQRSTFGDELGSAPAFMEWNDPDIIHNATDFQRAAGKETGTFNWTYVDSRDVAYYMAGKLPVRNPHINPNFPTWGTGQWDWQGFAPADLTAADPHPRASTRTASGGIVNGTFSNGFFTNWNNKPAPGFSAADNQYAYGPVYRVQSLSDRVGALLRGGHLATQADLINAMEDGGTVDLDGAQLVGPMAAVLSGTSLTTKEQQVLTILQTWAADPFWGTGVPGAHRRDRTSSGSYEQGSAVAIMDKLYPRLAHAVFDPWLNSSQFGQLNGLNPMLDAPRAQGSAYDGGWEGYLQRALRQAVNPAIANGYSHAYCGGNGSGVSGNLSTCQAAVKAALDSTITQLDKLYGTQTQTCPVAGNPSADPDPVTLVGSPVLSPPDHMLNSYSISSSETAGEKNDGLPHGVTISYSITTIDTPGGSSTNSNDTQPPAGSASGDFTTAAPFQLRAELPGSARTYQVDWNASFDGSNGISVHTCSSTDGTHHPFTVTVRLPPAVPWTCARSNDTGGRSPGSAQDDNTRCNPELDDIQYAVVGVGTVPSMPWVNRPTFQQVVQYPAGRTPR
jgi:acyl-homoserine lactone acylase PvdQ